MCFKKTNNKNNKKPIAKCETRLVFSVGVYRALNKQTNKNTNGDFSQPWLCSRG